MKHIVYILHTIVVLFRLGFLFSQREWTNNLSQPSYGQISLFSSSGWDSSVTISPLSTQIDITKETSFQHVSLDSIVAWLSDQTQYHDSNFVTTEYLRNQYRSDPNTIENTKKFVNQLVQEFEYDEAYAVIQSGGFSLQQSLDPHIVLHILFNSELINNKNKDLQTIQAFIDQSYKEQRIVWSYCCKETKKIFWRYCASYIPTIWQELSAMWYKLSNKESIKHNKVVIYQHITVMEW